MTNAQTASAKQDQPTNGYLLCGSPRSGSTMLCDLLVKTGVAGNPESYFRTQSISDYAHQWGDSSATDSDWGQHYIAQVRKHAMSPNGCVGIRIMWSNMPEVLEVFKALSPDEETDRDRLRSSLGIQHYVHLYREDKVAQAVSLVIAIQTGLWHLNSDGTVREGGAEPRSLRYDEAAIARELDMLEAEEKGWQAWFDAQSINPIRISYESLASDPQAALQLTLAGIDQALPGPLPNVGTAPTGGAINRQWVEKYRRENSGNH